MLTNKPARPTKPTDAVFSADTHYAIAVDVWGKPEATGEVEGFLDAYTEIVEKDFNLDALKEMVTRDLPEDASCVEVSIHNLIHDPEDTPLAVVVFRRADRT